MKSEIKYIELKSGYSDDGPAWIGRVEFSKSGQTVYFNGRAFRGNGHGSCYELETGEHYWITGIKKNGQNRHWAGNGKIMIDREIVDEYLALIGLSAIDLSKFELTDIGKTDKQKFVAVENSSIYEWNGPKKDYEDFEGLSVEEIRTVIDDLRWREMHTRPNNGKKSISVKLLDAEKLFEELQSKY